MKVGDLVRFLAGYPDEWSGTVGLVVGVRGMEILVSRASGQRWMRPDAAEVISASR